MTNAAVPSPPGIVLKRRRGQRILLSDGTVFEIVDARGGYCHVRLWAPSGAGIYREEIAPENLRRAANQHSNGRESHR